MTSIRMRRFVIALVAVGVLSFQRVTAEQRSDPGNEPLQLKSQYKGKLTQQGKHPDVPNPPAEFECLMVITKRQKTEFEAEMRLKSGGATITYLAKGKMGRITSEENSYTVDFQWVGMKDTSTGYVSIPGVPLSGTLKNGKMKGTWKYPKNDRGITLEGSFELDVERSDK